MVPPSVANGGFAPLGGAAATPVAALKTPVAFGKEGSGVVARQQCLTYKIGSDSIFLYHP